MNLTLFKHMIEPNGLSLGNEVAANFKIECASEEGILHLILSGRWTRKNDASLESEFAETIRRHSAGRVLADICELEGRLGVVDCYVHVQRLAPECRMCKTAFLDLPENLEEDSFMQTIAQNRGFPIRYFTNRVDAIRWLNE